MDGRKKIIIEVVFILMVVFIFIVVLILIALWLFLESYFIDPDLLDLLDLIIAIIKDLFK